jgi:hypothetical protein
MGLIKKMKFVDLLDFDFDCAGVSYTEAFYYNFIFCLLENSKAQAQTAFQNYPKNYQK